MAVLHGKQGSVHQGTTKIINTTNWTLNAIQETAESRVHEADWVERVGGLRDWNATIEGNISAATAGAGHLVNSIVSATSTTLAAGTLSVVLRQIEGTLPVFRGVGHITDFSASAPVDGVQTFSATIAGSGGALRYSQT